MVAFFADVVTSVTVLAKPAVPGVVTAVEGLAYSAAEFLPFLPLLLTGTALAYLYRAVDSLPGIRQC